MTTVINMILFLSKAEKNRNATIKNERIKHIQYTHIIMIKRKPTSIKG